MFLLLICVPQKNNAELHKRCKRAAAKEQTREMWLALGVLIQGLLVLCGAIFLPFKHLNLWMTIVACSLLLTLWGLLNIWWEQRKYTTYDRWEKHVDRKRISKSGS